MKKKNQNNDREQAIIQEVFQADSKAEDQKGSKKAVKSSKPYTDMTGSSLSFTEAMVSEDYNLVTSLEKSLADVKGQAVALHTAVEYFFGINNRENPNGVGGLMVFLGPPAVGKTMVGEKIAEALHRPYLRLDMSGYNDKEIGLVDLFGISRTYRSSQAGQLTTFVEENPVSVVLLDEFEKAHVNVHNRFLQIFDRGDARDLFTERNVSFRDVIFIVTMNLGRDLYNRTLATYNLSDIPQATVVNALKSEINPQTGDAYLSEAIVSRFASGRIILFNRLSQQILYQITIQEIRKCVYHYKEKYGISFQINELDFAKVFILSLGENADARTAKKVVREFFEKNLVRMVKMSRCERKKVFTEVMCEIDFSNADPEAKDVISCPVRSRVLVCCDSEHREKFKSHASDSVELLFAETAESAESLADKDLSMAILDTGMGESLSKKLFDGIAKLAEIPIYVYDLKAESDVPLLYYLDHGAADVFHNGKAEFDKWLTEILSGVDLVAASQALSRANKVVTFEPQYSFKSVRTAVLKVANVGITTAKESADVDRFVSARQIPNVRFEDIYGAKYAKEALRGYITDLKNFRKNRRLGIRPPRGVLLEGDPGTGKTMLAKAVASETGLPFIQHSASEFLQQHVGEGGKLVRELFASARRYAPAIIFIDEVDAIAKTREGSGNEGCTEVLNTFLSEMDGFSDTSLSPVFVIATTNFSATKGETCLDPAFLRRFDRKIHIDLPDLNARKQYLTDRIAKYKNKVSARMINIIAKRSIGWSIGELDVVVQNALRASVCGDDQIITDKMLNEMFERYANGESKQHDEEKARKTAIHEAGHAVVAALLETVPTYATINARGGYGGYVYYGNENSTYFSREELMNRVCIAMAGRAAEIAFYGDAGITSGASGDLKLATELATRMVCDYGMDEAFPIYIEPSKRSELPWVTERVIEIIKQQANAARSIIEKNTDTVNSVADALLKKISLDDTDLRELINK